MEQDENRGGSGMTVKVLIKRNVPRSNNEEIMKLFAMLRSAAMNQPGYIGGETLKRVDAPGKYLVISSWKSVDDWSRWLVSPERRQIQERIDALTDSETKFEVYEH
ncbi:MAG: antibiotic biosynthesis monooxygenase [Desulfarculaceae bacterium]|nr:antibiotic biosynthesis monooxygenase [Desulfarculaceae bacterium]